MKSIRDAALAAWREAGEAALAPCGFTRRGQVWRRHSDGMDRLLLLEVVHGGAAVRAHYVHPALDDTTVRQPGWSSFCYPAVLVDEDHRVTGMSDLETVLSRHAGLGVCFLERCSSPADVVRLMLGQEACEEEGVQPVPGSARGLATAALWASASGLPDWKSQAMSALAALPGDRYVKEVRAGLAAKMATL